MIKKTQIHIEPNLPRGLLVGRLMYLGHDELDFVISFIALLDNPFTQSRGCKMSIRTKYFHIHAGLVGVPYFFQLKRRNNFLKRKEY